jgi:hypothetical protein
LLPTNDVLVHIARYESDQRREEISEAPSAVFGSVEVDVDLIAAEVVYLIDGDLEQAPVDSENKEAPTTHHGGETAFCRITLHRDKEPIYNYVLVKLETKLAVRLCLKSRV